METSPDPDTAHITPTLARIPEIDGGRISRKRSKCKTNNNTLRSDTVVGCGNPPPTGHATVGIQGSIMGCTGHGDKRLMEHACASSFVCEVNGAAVTLLASAVKSKHPDLSGVLGWACYRKTAKLVTCGRFELSSNNRRQIKTDY